MTRQRDPLGVTTLAALVIGNMIGAGVFTTSGLALADLGSPVRVLAAWLVGGLLALLGALCYGRLVRLVPASGGEYLYLSRNVHPLAGFVAGWISLWAGFTAAIAFAALTFAAYAVPGGGGVADSAVATLVIAVAAVLHAVRVREGAWVQNAAVALKLVCLAAFCVAAVRGDGVSAWTGLAELGADAYAVPPLSISAFALSLMWISFSYSGFNAAVYIAGEVPAARERVPRALVIGTVTTLLVYLAVNAVFVLVPAFDAVAGAEDVAAVAARTLGGEPLAAAFRAVIALALFTSVSAMIMIGPRVYAKMADDGLLPRRLGFSGETPAVAVALQAVLAVAVVWIAGLRELLSYLGMTLGLSTAATVATLFVAARRDPERGRGWRGYPLAPAAFVAFTLLNAGLAATQQPWEMVAAAATIGSGVLLYFVVRRHTSTGPAVR